MYKWIPPLLPKRQTNCSPSSSPHPETISRSDENKQLFEKTTQLSSELTTCRLHLDDLRSQETTLKVWKYRRIFLRHHVKNGPNRLGTLHHSFPLHTNIHLLVPRMPSYGRKCIAYWWEKPIYKRAWRKGQRVFCSEKVQLYSGVLLAAVKKYVYMII